MWKSPRTRRVSTMSKKFATVKAAYDRGSWNKAMVKNAVVKGWITEEEYLEITGEVYEA
jgi:uncharacterized XkdX family phage protein